MDLRQLVIVSSKRDPVVEGLCKLFNLEVAFNDPGIIHFGLENALLPIGRTFLEVISPVQDGTTAERFLNRRNGDGGYMIIIQVDDFIESKNLVDTNKISIVWESTYPEAKAMHLHPKQMGGAILSLDYMDPPTTWKWAGDDWEKNINLDIVNSIRGVQIQSNNPSKICGKWQSILGRQSLDNKIFLDNTWIEFIDYKDGRGEGIYSFDIQVKDILAVKKRAKNLNFLIDNKINIGGVIFTLSS
jgi:hypothetical protein